VTINDPVASRAVRPRSTRLLSGVGSDCRLSSWPAERIACAGVKPRSRMHVIAGNGPSADDRRQMHSDSRAPAHEVLAGLVERVTFHNEESGFCVLRA
jgi:hypothetical protein